MNDPLDDRDEVEREVSEKRLIEAMDEEAQRDQVRRILEIEDVRDFLWRVMEWGRIFGSVHDPNNSKMSVMEGRRQLCLQLLAEINLANPKAWLAMQLKAAEIAATAAQAEGLKRLRKGRST